MKYEIQISARGEQKSRSVELSRLGDRWSILLDGVSVDADVVQISENVFSVILRGVSHEICVTPNPSGALTLQSGLHEFRAEVLDPRAWSGRRHGHAEAEGRQEILAPMPGKVIRLLAAAGDKVESGQGILVVEAMKMQNEIRSPKSGTVERILAKEGQTVNAGDVLAWVD